MSAIDHKKRQQLIQTAEGYLDLAVMFEDRWPLADEHRKKMASRAIGCLNQIRNPQGHRSYFLFLKGQAHRIASRMVQAIRFFEQSIEIEPDHIPCLLALAWCYKRTNQLSKALQVMELATRQEPDSAIAHYNLACYAALMQKTNLALVHLSIALDLNSDYGKLVSAENDFNLIRDLPSFREILSVHA